MLIYLLPKFSYLLSKLFYATTLFLTISPEGWPDFLYGFISLHIAYTHVMLTMNLIRYFYSVLQSSLYFTNCLVETVNKCTSYLFSSLGTRQWEHLPLPFPFSFSFPFHLSASSWEFCMFLGCSNQHDPIAMSPACVSGFVFRWNRCLRKPHRDLSQGSMVMSGKVCGRIWQVSTNPGNARYLQLVVLSVVLTFTYQRTNNIIQHPQGEENVSGSD